MIPCYTREKITKEKLIDMGRESFKSRLGFYTGKRRMRNRNWKCVEISVCGRTEWRRNFCTVLSDIPDCHGASGTDNGISSPEEPAEKVQF